MRKSAFFMAFFAIVAFCGAAQIPDRSYCGGYGRTEVEAYWGSEANAHLSAGVTLSGANLNGTTIEALRFALAPAGNMRDCMVFIKKSADSSDNLYEQEFSPAEGWNTVWLDYPFGVGKYESLFVGYEMTCKGSPVGYVKADRANDDADRVRNGFGPWQSLSGQVGSPVELSLAAILTGGDYSGFSGDAVTLSVPAPAAPALVRSQSPFNVNFAVVNAGINTLRKLNVSYAVDGIPAASTTFDVEMTHCGVEQLTLPVEVGPGHHSVEISAGPADGATQSFEFTTDAFDRAYERRPLIELFTSQRCTNCPTNEEILKRAVAAAGVDPVIIAHHAGFTPDNFTIDESECLADRLGISTAPNIMLDRTPAKAGQSMALVFNPGYATATHFTPYRRLNTRVGAEIEAVYHRPDNMIKVSVTVEKDLPFNIDAPALNVAVCEDNIIDYQLIQGSNDKNHNHSDVIRMLLTPVAGQPFEFDPDGRARFEFSATVPADKNIKPENLKVAAFVGGHDLSTLKLGIVNAWAHPVEVSEEAAVKQIESIESPADDVQIYNLAGQPVSNPTRPGIYIRNRAKILLR